MISHDERHSGHRDVERSQQEAGDPSSVVLAIGFERPDDQIGDNNGDDFRKIMSPFQSTAASRMLPTDLIFSSLVQL